MLALLSAPRGRVSAARIAARARNLRNREAFGIVIHLPRARASDAPVPSPRALRIGEDAR